MKNVTIGEALCRRVLKKRSTAQNTVHGYISGQHGATMLGPTDCVLSWVDNKGAVCIVPCEFVDGEWKTKGVTVRATQNFVETRTALRGSLVKDDSLMAIQKAEAKKKGSPPPAGKPEKDPPQGQESGDPASGT